MAKNSLHQSDLDLVGQIYEAALEPELWPEFVSDFALRIKANAGVLSFHNVEEMELSFIKSYGRDEKKIERYREYFININPYLAIVKELPFTIFTSQKLIDEEKLIKSEYYNDWLLPQDIHYHAGAIIFRDEARLAMIDMQRPKETGPFENHEIEIIKVFEPHLRRALLINQKFWDLLANPDAATTVLDNLEIGVIFLDEISRPVYLNRKAEELTKFGDGIVVRPDGLSAEWPEQSKALRKLIFGAVETGKGKGIDPGGFIRVGIRTDAPHHVMVSPMRTKRNNLGLTNHRICAAVFISSPNHPHAVSVESLKNLFGLTSAEANLVEELANGRTLDDISDKFEISKNTARGQLKSIFSKTGTRRQVDLVNLIRSSPTSFLSEGILLGNSLGGPFDRRAASDRRNTARPLSRSAGGSTSP